MPLKRKRNSPPNGWFLQKIKQAVVFGATVCMFAACAPGTAFTPTATVINTAELSTPTFLPSSTLSSTPTVPPETPTPIPSPTSTPQLHIIQAGEDLGGIAYRYHVTVDAILAVNPGVEPQLLHIGDSLVIPPSTKTADQTTAVQPTPINIQLSQPVCHLSRSGGAWCFTLASNTTGQDVENVSVKLFAAGSSASDIISVVSTAPLNLLRTGQSLPVAVYFPPPLTQPVQASVELHRLLPASNSGQRYLAAQSEEKKLELSADGLSVHVSGMVKMEYTGAAASHILVLAVGYDASGQVVGIKRKEYNSPPDGGQNLPFDLWLYSAGPKMAQVDVMIEAVR